MFGGVFSEMSKCLCHLRTKDISTMAQILKGLYPHNSCPFNSTNKKAEPCPFCIFEQSERQGQDRRQKDENEMYESKSMGKDRSKFLPKGFGVLDKFGIYCWRHCHWSSFLLFVLRQGDIVVIHERRNRSKTDSSKHRS